MKPALRSLWPVVLGGLVLFCSMGQACAMNQYAYDLDSLAYMSTDVVEATLGGQTTVKDYAVTQATVDVVYKGHFHPGQTVALDSQTLAFFRKTKGSDFFRGQDSLTLGDHMFLFLTKAKAAFLYNVPKDADIYWPAPSGIKLVQDGKVLSFQQFSNPGPYQTITPQIEPKAAFPTPAQFAERVNASLQYAASAALLLAPPGTNENVPRLLALLHARANQENNNGFFSRDQIAEDACARLADTHDFTALSEALPFGGYECFRILAQGFSTSAGHTFVLTQIANKTLPVKQRVLFANTLRRNHFMDDAPADWMHVAELAEANQAQKDLCLALLWSVEDFVNETAQYAQQRAATPAQQQASAQVLSLLTTWYGKVPSETVQFEIEKIATYNGQAAYDALHSPCGPIPSLARPGQNPAFTTENGTRKLWISYDAQMPFENDADVSVVATLTNQDTKVITVLPTNFSLKTWQIGSGGGGSGEVALPDSLLPGPYHICLQFRRGVRTIGTSHGFSQSLN